MIKPNYILKIWLFAIIIIYSQTQQKIDWPSLADSPWPTIRGDMQGTGRSEFVGPKTPNVIWKADLPLGILYGPVIGYADILFFGTYAIDSDFHNHFYAYFSNGTEYWNYETNSGIPNSIGPLISRDNTIYMGSNAGELFAFTHDGILKWNAYIGEGRRPQISIDKNGNLYTYSLDRLRILNSAGENVVIKYFDQISSDIVFSPDGSTLYLKSGNHNDGPSGYSYLNSTDLEGNLKWRYKFYGSNYAPVAVDNQENIYVYGDDSTDYRKRYLYSITKEGEKRWGYPLGGYGQNVSATIDNEGNIIFSGYNVLTGFPSIISLKNNGEVNWVYFLTGDDPYDEEPDHGLVCDAEGNIYFGSTWGTFFYALNKDSKLMWKLPLNDYEYDSSPAIGSDGTLYLGTHISTFYQDHKENLIAIRDNSGIGR